MVSRRILLGVLALVVAGAFASTADADSYYWNTASGAYGTSGNWMTGGLPSTLVPGATDVVYIGNAGVLGESTITSGVYSNAALYVDNAVSPGPTPGVLSISVGTLTTKAAQIGFGAGLGTVNVSGSNLGRLAITGSTATDNLVIGQLAGAVGSLNVSGGTVAVTMALGGVFNLGGAGNGVIYQTGGVVQGLTANTRMIIGGSYSPGNSGVYNLTAGTADFTQVTVGGNGAGSLNISGGRFTHQVTGEFRMGQSSGSVGMINQTGGSLHSLASLFMGYNAGSEATYNTTGAASSAYLGGLAVGRGGHGVVNIESGATVTVGANGLYVGFVAGGSGTVNVRGRLNAKSAITYVGGFSGAGWTSYQAGLLNVETGGLLDLGAQQMNIGFKSKGALTMSGGSLGSSSYIFVGSSTLLSGGSSVDVSGGRINSLTLDYGNVGTAVGTISGTAEIFTTNRVTVGNLNRANVVMTGGSIRPLYLQIAVDSTAANGSTLDQSGGRITVYGAGSISLGKQAEGKYNLGGTGAVTAPSITLGTMSGGNGTLNIATGGDMTIANFSTIGAYGKGRVVVSGGVFNMGTSITSASNVGGTYDSVGGTYGSGFMEITGGAVTAYGLGVGQTAPNAELKISGGSLNISNALGMAANAIAANTKLTVLGNDATINVGAFTTGLGNSTLSMGIASDGISTINVAGDATFGADSFFDVFFDSFTPTPGSEWVAMQAGAIFGSANLEGTGAGYTIGDWSFSFRDSDIDGDLDQLLVSTVPEPSTVLLLGLGLAGMIRRRK